MEREISRELERLLHSYEDVLREIRTGTNDDQKLASWHKLQVLGWELNALLPTGRQTV